MPRILRTLIPRFRSSLRERGLVVALCRSVLLPAHLMKEFRTARFLRGMRAESEFDRSYGLDTEGEHSGWTYLSDLNISSSNWFEGRDYAAIEPERFRRVLANIEVPWEEFTFLDFGSGKGRALLLASEYPFKRIAGLEFSPELHRIAEANIAAYRSDSQKCRAILSLNVDFVDFVLPDEPLVLFFFDPCRGTALKKTMEQIGGCLRANSHPVLAAYVAPSEEVERLFKSCGFKERHRNREWNFVLYERRAP
jgi:SAM-dependent methyltransferase